MERQGTGDGDRLRAARIAFSEWFTGNPISRANRTKGEFERPERSLPRSQLLVTDWFNRPQNARWSRPWRIYGGSRSAFRVETRIRDSVQAARSSYRDEVLP